MRSFRMYIYLQDSGIRNTSRRYSDIIASVFTSSGCQGRETEGKDNPVRELCFHGGI